MTACKVGIPKTNTGPKTITVCCMHTCGSNKCMHVIHSGEGLGITCITMYNMHTFVASTRMHAVHSDDFRFSDGFGYLNVTRFCVIPSFHTLPCALLSLVVAKVCVCLMWSFFSIISLYLSGIWHDLY